MNPAYPHSLLPQSLHLFWRPLVAVLDDAAGSAWRTHPDVAGAGVVDWFLEAFDALAAVHVVAVPQ